MTSNYPLIINRVPLQTIFLSNYILPGLIPIQLLGVPTLVWLCVIEQYLIGKRFN
jgi:hypothetical protein